MSDLSNKEQFQTYMQELIWAAELFDAAQVQEWSDKLTELFNQEAE